MIKHVCFSSHDTPENLHKLIDTGEFEGLTIQYNLLNMQYGTLRKSNEDVILHANEAGMGVIVMGPIAGGKLATPSKEIQDMLNIPVKTSAELALKFVFSNQFITTALSGMNTMEQVEENCRIASQAKHLTDIEQKQVNEALHQMQKLADLYCTGCKYCMPCPNNVNIPVNFNLMNQYKIYGLKEQAQTLYDSSETKAENCIECGLCEPKCPQNIKIMEQLKEVASVFGKK